MGLSRFIADVRAASHAIPVQLVYRVHASPGRLRFRLPWLHDSPDEPAATIAEALAGIDGVLEVRVRVLTGSVLVLYDPEIVGEAGITRELLGAVHVGHVTARGQESEADYELMMREVERRGSAVSRTLVATVEALHADFLHLTGGRVSLASASALTMLAVGLGRFAATREVDLPPWHQLLWYAYQTFKDVQERYAVGQKVHLDGDGQR
jgi:copper chaperone CopZ